MSFRVQYGNERYVVCDDEAQRSTDVSGAPSRVQMSGTTRVQAKAKPLRETVGLRPPQPKKSLVNAMFTRLFFFYVLIEY